MRKRRLSTFAQSKVCRVKDLYQAKVGFGRGF
jgi:hypothetical protein